MSDLISREETIARFVGAMRSREKSEHPMPLTEERIVRFLKAMPPTAEPTIDDIAERICNTDWYHIFKGELRHGAHDREEALFKAEDIFNILKDMGASEEYIDQEWLDWREEQEFEDRWDTMERRAEDERQRL